MPEHDDTHFQFLLREYRQMIRSWPDADQWVMAMAEVDQDILLASLVIAGLMRQAWAIRITSASPEVRERHESAIRQAIEEASKTATR